MINDVIAQRDALEAERNPPRPLSAPCVCGHPSSDHYYANGYVSGGERDNCLKCSCQNFKESSLGRKGDAGPTIHGLKKGDALDMHVSLWVPAPIKEPA